MRKLYLVRHAKPDFPDGRRWCIGRTDLPLGVEGRLQACLLGAELRSEVGALPVFCSSLKRSRETAQYLGDRPVVWDGLLEQHAGAWDGCSFEEIRQRWPGLYVARGENPELQPPGAEDSETAVSRFEKAVGEILRACEKDVIVVAHKTVMQLFLCRLSGKEFRQKREFELPYASVTTIAVPEAADISVGTALKREGYILQECGTRLHPPLNQALCDQLLGSAGTPAAVQKHCHAVAAEAERIAEELLRAGMRLDRNLTVQGALLHDIARGYEHHEAAGADWLWELGYGELAAVIRSHHDLDIENEMPEAMVIYLADKCIQGEKKVSVEERFEKSLDKCKSQEAKEAHRRRYKTAAALKEKVNARCGKDVVL